MTTRLARLLALTMLLGSCALLPTASTLPEDTTTTSPTIGNGGSPTNPTPTTAPTTEPVSGAIVVTDQAVTIIYDEGPAATLTGDVDYALKSAFVDLIGGLVFQYADPGPGVSPGILRLLPGTIEPIELIAQNDGESLTLVDVALIDGRPNVVYLIRTSGQEVGGQLVAADLQGGAPAVLYDGPDLVSGDVDDSLIIVELRVNSACNKLVAFTGSDATWEADCVDGAGPASVAVMDGLVATVINGQLQVTDLNTEETTTYPVNAAQQVFDISEGLALVLDDSGALFTASESGQTALPAADVVRSASLFDSPLAVTEGHRLGGIRAAQGPCSAAGLPSVAPTREALPEAVAAIRAEIVERAVDCDFDGLAALTSPSFTVSFGGGDPRRLWMASEAQFGDDLSLIVRILNLPFAASVLPDGRTVYVWPSAATDQATDADWEAIRPVFNEEEIDAMRQQGGYTGHRVGIAEDGEWLFSVAGD